MPKHEAPDHTEGEEAGGLGFSQLSMNEIAPAVTQEPSGAGARTGRAWLYIVAVLLLLAGGGWLFRNAIDSLPAEDVQRRVEAEVKATSFSQKGDVQEAFFVRGDTLRISFARDLDTQNENHRAKIRGAMYAIMTLLVKALPQKDLTVQGFQGDHQMATASYLYRSALTANGEIETVISVENGQDDPRLATKVHDSRSSAPARGEGASGP